MARSLKDAEDDLRFSSVAYSALEEARQTALDERAALCRRHRGTGSDPYEQFAEWMAAELADLMIRADERLTALAPKVVEAELAQEAEDREAEEMEHA